MDDSDNDRVFQERGDQVQRGAGSEEKEREEPKTVFTPV